MKYVPALGIRALTRFYEPVVRWTMKDDRMKGWIVDALDLRDGLRVADIGCGPGALAVRIKKAHPGVWVVGVDGDPEVLALARAKAADAGVDVTFEQGLATAPPLADESFDRVVMSLVLHHLRREDKHRALRAAHNLLRPGGKLHVVDWGEARSLTNRAAFLSIQLLDGFANTGDHVRGALPEYIRDAGFGRVDETRRERTVYGIVSFYEAVRA
jgi:SAM-dependent methyltransferase